MRATIPPTQHASGCQQAVVACAVMAVASWLSLPSTVLAQAEQPTQAAVKSSLQGKPEKMFFGNFARLQLTLVNPTDRPRLLQVEATLNNCALLVGASDGGGIVLPEEAPLSQSVRWPSLSLPEHTSRQLELEIVARRDTDAGDLSVDFRVDSRSLEASPGEAQAEHFNFYRQLSYGGDQGLGSPPLIPLIIVSLPPLAFLAWLIASRKLPPENRWRRAAGQVAAGAFAAQLLMICYGLFTETVRPYTSYRETQCTILDRRVVLETASSKGGSQPSLRPLVAATYATDQGPTVSTGFATAGASVSPRKLDRFPLAAEVPCWYDPESPEVFVLVRGPDAVSALLILLSGLSGVGLAAGVLVSLWRP